MSFDVTIIESNSPDYPSSLRNETFSALFSKIWAIGNINIFEKRLLGLFCSVKCPGNIILRTYDMARALRDEKDCLDLLLHGTQPVIICPARSIRNMRIASEHKTGP